MEVFNIFYINKFNNKYILLFLLGSILGASIRFQINNHLVTNVIGCTLLGVIVALKLDQRVKVLLSIGFCSSLTSFSGWIFAVFDLFKKGFVLHSVFLLIFTLISGFVSLRVGFFMGRRIKQYFLP